MDFVMTITIKGTTRDMVSGQAVVELGQRTAAEVLAQVRLLPHWGNIGVPKVELHVSRNFGKSVPVPFKDVVQDTIPDTPPKKENPFEAM